MGDKLQKVKAMAETEELETVERFRKGENNFLKVFADTGSFEDACTLAGWTKAAAYSQKRSNKFVVEFRRLKAQSVFLLEEEAHRRAMGYDEEVVCEGKVIGSKRKHSDALIMFLLKANNPGKYGEKSKGRPPGGVAGMTIKSASQVGGVQTGLQIEFGKADEED